MKFSKHLWEKISLVYEEILTHPFNVELAHGTLSQERFMFYMKQDSYYLIEFSKVLALIASRSRSVNMTKIFLDFSLNALLAERSLHADFLKEEKCETIERDVSPACLAYTRYLIATTSTASLEEAVAAILPCFWVYREVGKHIEKTAQETNPYIRWINTYASEEFSDGVDQVISVIDDLAIQSSPRLQALMIQAFEHSTLFEWHFWNDAYHLSMFRESYAKGQRELSKFMHHFS